MQGVCQVGEFCFSSENLDFKGIDTTERAKQMSTESKGKIEKVWEFCVQNLADILKYISLSDKKLNIYEKSIKTPHGNVYHID